MFYGVTYIVAITLSKEGILMRKIGWWLLPTFFLFVLGCGGGGQTTSGTTPGGEVDPALPAGYGLIKLTIHQENTGAPVEGLRTRAPAGGLPAADNVRIAARLVSTQTVPILDDNGNPTGETAVVTSEFYRKIVDVSLPATTAVSIAVPAADGYVVEVLSSVSGTDGSGNPVHILLKHGKTTAPLSVTAGVDTPAAIVATPITAGLTFALPILPDGVTPGVVAGSKYSVPVTITGVPLRGSFYLQQFVDNQANSAPAGLFVNESSPKNATFTAQSLTTRPSPALDHWNLYFQGLFFIDPTWQSDAEKSNTNWYKKFVFYYPNRNTGWVDPFLTTPLYPLGTVNITVTLSPSR
jgi:hypothetical protein